MKPTGRTTLSVSSDGHLVLVAHRGGGWYGVTCFGPKRHFRKDGSCKHTDAVMESIVPEMRHRVRLEQAA